MESSRRISRYLRITVTALGITACVLLVALWVRSYWWVEQVFIPITASKYVAVGSMPSVFAFGLDDATPNVTLSKVSSPTIDWLAAVSEGTNTPWSSTLMFSISANGFTMPYWFGVLLSVAVGTAPWIHWSRRFSIRTLLIATTLVAVVLGVIAISS